MPSEKEIEAAETVRGDWRDIESAPKDGTKIVIGKSGWQSMPVAYWITYPSQDFYMQGWSIEDNTFYLGCEDGFLGWNEDLTDGNMPTHWQPLPQPPKPTEK